MNKCSGEDAPAQPKSPSIGQALRPLLRNPWRRLVLRWNGKAALLSAVYRGGIFLAASIKSGHAGRSSGALAEALFGAMSAGFFGTLTQALRFADPQWAAGLLLAGIYPLLFQLCDLFFHAALGTQVFRTGMIASAVLTALSAAFNLYIMRRGTLLVGNDGNSFAHDLSALPRLALLFVASGAVILWRFIVDGVLRIPRNTVASSRDCIPERRR
jgi:hypothetical protein